MSPTTSSIVLFVGCFAFLAVGSFVCVIIDRLPVKLDEPNEFGDSYDTRPWREVFGGNSRCSSCDAHIPAYDKVPVASWIMLRGKCRNCGVKIEAYHPLVELGAAAAFVLSVWALGVTWLLVPVLWFVPVGLAISVIDLRTLIVPTRIIWPATGVLVALSVVTVGLIGEWGRLPAAAIGVLVVAGLLFVLWFVVPAGMGFGDVRLAVMVGFLVGFYSGDGLVTAAMLAVICLLGASVFGLLMGVVALGVRGRGVKIPFGPALVVAGFACALLASRILDPWAVTGIS